MRTAGSKVTFREAREAITEGMLGGGALEPKISFESGLVMCVAAGELLPAALKADANEELLPLPAFVWRRPGCTRRCASRPSLAALHWHLLQVKFRTRPGSCLRMEDVETGLA